MQNVFIPGPIAPPNATALGRAPDQLQSAVRRTQNATGSQRQVELKEAAQEFESLFVSYLMKVMRETIEESGLTEGGLGKDIYTELFDQEVSRSISRHGALGISDLLLKNLVQKDSSSATDQSRSPSQGGRVREAASIPSDSVPGAESQQQGDPASQIPDFRLPIQGPVSSAFGLRKDPFSRQVRFHKGLDLAAPEGTPVHAALAGEVIFAGYENGYGNTVVVQHADGLQTRYAHLAAAQVKRGEFVRPEQELGEVGSTGHSTGAHLHFEVIRFGERVDPGMALAD